MSWLEHRVPPPLVGLVTALLSLGFLLLHAHWTPARRADARCVWMCVVGGFGFDTALIQLGWVTFAQPNPGPLAGVQPGWMLLLWACMACTFQHSLSWLRRWPLLAYPVCGAFGFFAYDAAAWMGALQRTGGLASVVALVVFWAVFIPWTQRWSAAPSRLRA